MNKKTLLFAFTFHIICGMALAQTPTASRNYVMETTVKTNGVTDASQLASLDVDYANRTITYFDGIGRPIQIVQWKASPNRKDIVQFMVYDALGREAVKYLPYAEQTSNNGSFKETALANQTGFYGSGSWDANVARSQYPLKRTVFEASPLNRVLEQGAEGASWQPYSSGISNSGHTIKADSKFNAVNEVLRWTTTGSGATASSTFLPNTLYKTITRDENWTSGKGGTVEEFKDTEGRLVLKRIWQDESTALSTYYVYDETGNLRYVIPPAVSSTTFTETDAVFKNFVYGYHHDGRKRVIEKKIPGKGWDHLVYNKLDQIVMTQDSVQRINGKWSFVKYDAIGRTIITGTANSSSSRASWQASIDGQSVLWESRDDANSNGTGIGYSNLSLPVAGIAEYLNISYYDDYSFYGNSFGQPVSPQVADGRTRGLATGTKIGILGTGDRLLTVNYYDDKGRIVQTKSENHLGGTDIIDNAYNFAGELTASTRTHSANSTTTIIANSYNYDHSGRKISTKENINSQGEVVLNKFEYNEIGQLKQKSLHSTDNGATFLQSTKFSNNERGWLTGSNSPELSIRLGYDTTANPQYNGNISTQLWGTGFGNKFMYAYDKLSRLTNATSTGIYMSEAIGYDAMGNIGSMSRDGATTSIYSYTGNQLNYIAGGPLASSSYAYDGNGNATSATVGPARTTVSLAYNQLNLPVAVTGSGISLSYVYNAVGQKLKKTNSSTGAVSDYINGIQYSNGSIEFIQTEEGIARKSGGSYSYEYNLTDHLGNVRYTFNKHPTTGALQKLQADDYYAFGLRKSSQFGNNKYLYNGKELQEELEQYDYGARFYDPMIGRWNAVDPLSEKMKVLSPYVYGANNPIRFIDPDGKEIWIGFNVTDKDGGVTHQQVQYRNGKLYEKNGKEYKGNNNYVMEVTDDLNRLSKGDKELSKRLGTLQKSKNKHIIVMTEKGQGDQNSALSKSDDMKGIPTGSLTEYNPYSRTRSDEIGPPQTVLAHELLGHGYDADQGKTNFNKTKNGIWMFEVSAVKAENRARADLGMDKRKSYGGRQIPAYLLEDNR